MQTPVFSFCIPVHNRTDDLKIAFPHILRCAENKPPCEIVIVDYNSPDDLMQYIASVNEMKFVDGVSLFLARYTKRQYYHMAHARNISIRAAIGEWVVIGSADIYFSENFLSIVMDTLEQGFDFVRDDRYRGVIVCKRSTLMEIGGYDERFEFYSPEDVDLENRLIRYGCELGIIPNGHVHIIPTPNKKKIANYRLKLSKRDMAKLMRPILEENNRDNLVYANQRIHWGSLNA